MGALRRLPVAGKRALACGPVLHYVVAVRHSERESSHIDPQLLSDLWIFRAAARYGSISAAAQHLDVTAGAVSQRVLRLEARLGTELFRRQKSRITLTHEGTMLLDAMNDVSLTLNSALTRIDKSASPTLVVSCATSLATEWLMPRLQDFYRECSNIELAIRAERGTSSAAWMQRQQVDVLVHYSHDRADDLCELASLQEFTLPVCSRAYRSRLNGLSPKERDIVLMHDDDAWGEGEPMGAEWQEWLAITRSATGDLAIKAERHFNLAYLAYQAAMYGQGVAMGRMVSVSGLLAAGKLVPAFDMPPAPGAQYRIVSRTNAEVGSPAQRFSAWVAEAMARTQQEIFLLLDPDALSQVG